MKALSFSLILLSSFAILNAQDPKVQPQGSQFPGPVQNWTSDAAQLSPDSKKAFEDWIGEMKAWRYERLTRMGCPLLDDPVFGR